MTAGENKNFEGYDSVPSIPVSMRIHTEKPCDGWWNWQIAFLEEGYRDHCVVPWEECGRERRCFEARLFCSAVFDPVPDLHWFLAGITRDDSFCEWRVNEEGHFLTMQVWNLDAVKVRLRMFSECRKKDFCWNFVLDRDAFLNELHAAYTSFGAQDGWGAGWGDMAVEDGYREEVRIDDGTSRLEAAEESISTRQVPAETR